MGRATLGKQQQQYEAPSMQPACNELEALGRLSCIVPDTRLLETPSSIAKAKAGTVSYAVLNSIVRSSQLGLRPFQNAITTAINYDKCAALSGDDKLACQLDKALVNVGALFAEQVEGRVCTEVDPRFAHDTAKIINQVHHLLGLYQEMRVPKDRLIFRLPATWAAIQAANKLEAEGLATQVFLVFSMVQGVAAAQASVSVLQPNVGRVRDWFKKNPGAIKDTMGPREDTGFKSNVDNGVDLVKQLYTYCKKFHPKTAIMASGLRNEQDALALAGCDYLILPPRTIETLFNANTIQGYNDGLFGSSSEDGLERMLSPEDAAASNLEERPTVDAETFGDQQGPAGRELMRSGMDMLTAEARSLVRYFKAMATGMV